MHELGLFHFPSFCRNSILDFRVGVALIVTGFPAISLPVWVNLSPYFVPLTIVLSFFVYWCSGRLPRRLVTSCWDAFLCCEGSRGSSEDSTSCGVSESTSARVP
jgi:hypothetical protein